MADETTKDVRYVGGVDVIDIPDLPEPWKRGEVRSVPGDLAARLLRNGDFVDGAEPWDGGDVEQPVPSIDLTKTTPPVGKTTGAAGKKG